MVELEDGITLFSDGSLGCSSVDQAVKLKRSIRIDGVNIGVLHKTEELQKYNKLVPPSRHISVISSTKTNDLTWDLPDHYLTLNMWDFLVSKLTTDPMTKWDRMPEIEQRTRLQRLRTELDLFEERNMINLLRCLVYIVDTLNANDVCWGVGRGSSVSSYLLYVLEVHDVDSFAFKLPLSEFFH